MRLLLILILISPSLYAAKWDQLPMVPGLNEVDREVIEKNFDSLHPWKSGGVLPRSFKEAGLDSPVRLVACDIYLDGGSQFYLFAGSNGNYLAFCTDAGSYYSEEKKKSVSVDKPRLFLAAFHFTDKVKTLVPYNSATEHFLLAAVKSEVARITTERKK